MPDQPERPNDDAHLTRIPLTIVATATLHETPDVLVGVMAVDLDRVEERLHAAEQALAGKAWSRRLMERAYR